MKSLKTACKASAAKKISGMRKAYANGGRTGYALGGDVEDMDEPLAPASMKDDMGIEGMRAKKKLDKPSAKTNINIVIAASKPDANAGAMVPPMMPPVPGKPPMPPMPPMGAAPPPAGMMKNGGRMGYKNGGKVKHAAGGGLGRLEKAKAYGLKPAKGK